MSLFGQNSAGGGAGGGGLFSGLSVNTGSAPTEKRKSIFDASTSKSETQAQSSLFGNATPSSAPSLFGNTATASSSSTPFSFGKPATTTAAGPSLFTNTATTSAPGGSLFGTATTSSAPSSGLFGSTAPASAPSGGLFGSNATAAPSGGLFGANATAAPSGGLFGAKPAATGASSIFGSTAPAQNAAAPSMFGGQQATHQPQPSQQQNEVQEKQTRNGAYFSSLLERQKKKARLLPTDQGSQRSQLPTLNMDLGDLARKAQEIGGRGTAVSSQLADSRAHYLLAGSGVSPGKAYREFQSLDGDDSQVDRAVPNDTTVETEAYIRNLQAKGRDAVMRENIDRVYREVDSYLEQTLGIDFEEQKTRIMKHFGLLSDENDGQSPTDTGGFGKTVSTPKTSFSGSRSGFGRSAQKSLIGTPGSKSTTSFFKGDTGSKIAALTRGQAARDLREKERGFVEQVEALNKARLQGDTFELLQKFGDVEKRFGGDVPSQVYDSYQALREIAREGTSAQERKYAKEYANSQTRSEPLNQQILAGSRTFLEKSKYREIESIIEKNPREGMIGGQPTVVNKIRAYVRIRAARKDLPGNEELQQVGDDGDYCWVMIYYLIRCGFLKEAAEYVSDNAAFQSTDRRFVSYVTAYAKSPDRRLGRKLQDMIDGEYQQRAKLAPKGSVDPFRMACYKVVGRCDLALRQSDVGENVDDWLWLQFVLARQQLRDEEVAGDIFGLEQIQETAAEIGEKYFQKGQVDSSNQPGMFYLLLVLSGMFEQAVEFLHTLSPVSAVHLAIALDYYGLLRVADFNFAGNELGKLPSQAVERNTDLPTVTKTTTEQYQLNFVPLIAHYTAIFRAALPVAAVDYLSLICLNSDLKPPAVGQAQTNACHECLRELCLETREFARLLGDIRTDGSRVPGAIEQRAQLIKIETRQDFLKAITSQAATIANQRGQVADAVLLFHLCEDYNNVVNVLNRSLADAVSIDIGESLIPLEPLKPRQQNGQSSQSTQQGPTSSLSLTATTSNVELAKNMITLYNDNAAYYNKITAENREMIGTLLNLLSARAHLEAQPPRYMTCLEELNNNGILPLSANGDIPTIRAAAAAFGSLPSLLARCAGLSIVWAIRAIGGERDNIGRQGSWDTGYGNDTDALKEQLGSMAKDLMVFAGLVKYKLPARVYDMLTRAGGDVGTY